MYAELKRIWERILSFLKSLPVKYAVWHVEQIPDPWKKEYGDL